MAGRVSSNDRYQHKQRSQGEAGAEHGIKLPAFEFVQFTLQDMDFLRLAFNRRSQLMNFLAKVSNFILPHPSCTFWDWSDGMVEGSVSVVDGKAAGSG